MWVVIFLFLLKIDFIKLEDLIVENKIVNKHYFEYILNPGNNICNQNDPNSKVYMLVYVHTSPDNFKRRLSLRETWARRSMFRDMRIVFMMGDVEDKKTKSLLNLESNLYQDIVQENFLDAYRNLTYKGIMAMKWISEYCKNAQYILKVDDDMIVNTFALKRHLYNIDKHEKSNKTIMCYVFTKMIVQRDPNNKWYLSKDDFSQDFFDPYCSGSSFILTNDLPKILFNISLYIKFLWVDDYYITGLLIRGSNSTYKRLNSLYVISPNAIEKRFFSLKSDFAIFGHFGHSKDALNRLNSIWKNILIKNLRDFSQLIFENKFLNKNDFNYLPDFTWSSTIWDNFLNTKKLEFFNYDYY